MSSFDIENLLNFKPAHYQCEKCLGLLQSPPSARRNEIPICPICGVAYIPTDDYKAWHVGNYLRDNGHYVHFDNLIEHSWSLALIAKKLRRDEVPPLRALYQVLNSAKSFVHFITFGMSHLLIGALKITSQRIPVRGIVSNVDTTLLQELKGFPEEAPNFKVITYGTKASWAEMPHQKLIVIDGLFAFKGSANLSLNAWRKCAKGRDLVEVVTDVDDVIRLHNRLFSPLWGDLSDLGDSIEMSGIPF